MRSKTELLDEHERLCDLLAERTYPGQPFSEVQALANAVWALEWVLDMNNNELEKMTWFRKPNDD